MTEKTEHSGIWVYEYDRKYPSKYELTNVRYVLGEIFDTSINKTLVCIGINPSTAIPEQLDATLKRVQKYAKESDKYKYGAWYMLNIYPQRATDPDDMDKECNPEIRKENTRQIKRLFDNLTEVDVWCAWGANITEREYLKECLIELADEILLTKNISFKSKVVEGDSQSKHPLHPIASKQNMKEELEDFDLKQYLETL